MPSTKIVFVQPHAQLVIIKINVINSIDVCVQWKYRFEVIGCHRSFIQSVAGQSSDKTIYKFHLPEMCATKFCRFFGIWKAKQTEITNEISGQCVCECVCVCMVINQGRDNVAGRGHLMTAAASKSEEREGNLPHSIFSLGLCLCLFLGSRVYFKFIRKGEAAHLCTTGLAT